MLVFTGILFGKWIDFSFVYVAIVDKCEPTSKVKPILWYILPFFCLDGFLLSVLLISTPELRGLYKKKLKTGMQPAQDLPVSREAR